MPRTELPKRDESGPIDYLDEDPEIPTQKYCIVSFISPEKVMKNKEEFRFEKFVAWMDYEWKVKGLEIFLLKNEKELQEMYDNQVDFRTNIRGVKVRRAFATVEEAQLFSKVLQRRYPKDNLYIGKVGAWLPWDPSEHLMPEVEYAEKELNELMRKYKENEANKEMFFAEQREESIKAQKEENERRKKANAAEKALEDGLAAASAPVHPSEGAMRE